MYSAESETPVGGEKERELAEKVSSLLHLEYRSNEYFESHARRQII